MDGKPPAISQHDWQVTEHVDQTHAQVTCQTCGAVRTVDELWLMLHPDVVDAARAAVRAAVAEPMIRQVEEPL